MQVHGTRGCNCIHVELRRLATRFHPPLLFAPRSFSTARSLGQLPVGLGSVNKIPCLTFGLIIIHFPLLFAPQFFPYIPPYHHHHHSNCSTLVFSPLRFDLGVQILALSHMHAPGNPIGDQPRHPRLGNASVPDPPLKAIVVPQLTIPCPSSSPISCQP